VDALRKQLPDAVFDQVGIAPVVETGRRGAAQAHRAAGLAQQQRPGVGTKLAPGEVRHDFPAIAGLKLKRSLPTVCLRPAGDPFSFGFITTSQGHPGRPQDFLV
jgi:hypothetical protein